MLNSFKSKMAAVSGFVALGVSQAHAEVPAVVGTALTGIQTDALAAIDLVWPVVLAVAAGFIVLKVVKRVLSKI